jgi:ubiquinone/menaquinone biosynthesis C-methylase UbiE
LASEGVHNATLYETDGMAFPVADNCVDLVYTFIVMQHMESVEVFASNIKEVARCLKPSGLAAIYFGRVSRLSLNKRNNMLFRLDNLLERTPFTPRFIEKKARVNETNLLISVRYAKRIFRDVGLQVIRQGGSRKRVPDGGHLYGSQTLFIVKK